MVENTSSCGLDLKLIQFSKTALMKAHLRCYGCDKGHIDVNKRAVS